MLPLMGNWIKLIPVNSSCRPQTSWNLLSGLCSLQLNSIFSWRFSGRLPRWLLHALPHVMRGGGALLCIAGKNSQARRGRKYCQAEQDLFFSQCGIFFLEFFLGRLLGAWTDFKSQFFLLTKIKAWFTIWGSPGPPQVSESWVGRKVKLEQVDLIWWSWDQVHLLKLFYHIMSWLTENLYRHLMLTSVFYFSVDEKQKDRGHNNSRSLWRTKLVNSSKKMFLPTHGTSWWGSGQFLNSRKYIIFAL